MKYKYDELLVETSTWNIRRCRRLVLFVLIAMVLYMIEIAAAEFLKKESAPEIHSHMLFLKGEDRCYIESYNDLLEFAGYNDTEEGFVSVNTLDNLLDKVEKQSAFKPVNASLSFENMQPVIHEGCKGMAVDRDELRRRITYAIRTGGCTVDIPTKTEEPEITGEYISNSYGMLSSFFTTVASSSSDRTQNIRIAAGHMDGTVVRPGEIFSANKAIGPRTKAAGYRNAPVFVGGKVAQGLAGGICQLVTTTYNAALLCDYEIVERRNHGFAVGYIKAGQDATISGDAVDLKFKNTGSFSICIRSYVKNNKVTVEIYGVKEDTDRRVEVSAVTLSHSATSIKTVTYRRVYEGDALVKEEELSRDTYRGQH